MAMKRRSAVGFGMSGKGELSGKDDHRPVRVVVRAGHPIIATVQESEHLLHGIDALRHVRYAGPDHVGLGQVDEIDVRRSAGMKHAAALLKTEAAATFTVRPRSSQGETGR